MLQSLSLKERLSLGTAIVALIVLLIGKYTSFYLPEILAVCITAAAYILIAYDVVVSAFRTLIKRFRMNEQFLMMIATFGAFALRDYPEALAVMVFYRIGDIFEEYASGRAHNEITSLIKLKPTRVRTLKEDGSEEILPPRKVKIGTKIRVLPGEAIALDGYLLNNTAAVDMSSLTGESEPALFVKGQEVPSGAINTSSVIELTVSRDNRNSSITRLLNLIEDAAANKSRPEALITRFSVYYTPLVVGAAVILALVPLVLPGAAWDDWLTRSLVFLVVSCPCALVLSVPLSFFGGLGAASKCGVIIKGSVHIENLAKLKCLAFDKTGTVTRGEFKVKAIDSRTDENELISAAYALELNSTHPVARGIQHYASRAGAEPVQLESVTERSGLGIEGRCADGTTLRAGKYVFIREFVPELANTESAGTDVYVARDNTFLGVISLYDAPKDNASEMFRTLDTLGVKSCLITGDKKLAAEAVARELGIGEVMSEQMPEDKLTNFKKLQQHYGLTGFTGDGINDAPVLASADVGIAMGQFGSAAAVEASDVVVMNDDLRKIPLAIRISRKTFSLALQNLWLAIGIKAVILILGALGFANIWLAIFGDVGVLVLCVLNAMRSLGYARLELKAPPKAELSTAE